MQALATLPSKSLPTVHIQSGIQPGFQNHHFFGDGMHKFQPFGAQSLMFPAKIHAFRQTVLGITQNRIPHIGAMHPQLMGTAGDGSQG
jgi:hypothetical protein